MYGLNLYFGIDWLKDEIKPIVSVISIGIHIWQTSTTCQFICVTTAESKAILDHSVFIVRQGMLDRNLLLKKWFTPFVSLTQFNIW